MIVLRVLWDIFLGCLMAIGVFLLITALIGSCSQMVFGHDVVRIDELDRSITTSQHDHGNDALVDMALIQLSDYPPMYSEASTLIYEQRVRDRCAAHNARLQATRDMLDGEVEKHPELASRYVGAYRSIEEEWCSQ